MKKAQVGDTIRLTEEAWDKYFQCVQDAIPSDSWLHQQNEHIHGRELTVLKLFEERHAPIVSTGNGGYAVIEHDWYEIVD